MFSRIVPKLLTHKDICELSDDRNPGAFNVFKHCGKWWGCLCLLLDILKGFVPVLLASLFMDTENWLFMLVMIAPVLGHALGIFNRFRGGKCISVSFGVMYGILPVTWIGFTVLAALYILFLLVPKIGSNRTRSIIVYTLYGVIAGIVYGAVGMAPIGAGCVIIGLIAAVKHLMSSPVQEGELT